MESVNCFAYPVIEENAENESKWLRIETPMSSRSCEYVWLPKGRTLYLGDRGAIVRSDVLTARECCQIRHDVHGVWVSDLAASYRIGLYGVGVTAARLDVGHSFEWSGASVQLVSKKNHEEEHESILPLEGLLGESLPIRTLARQIRMVAKLKLPVLIRGESGTGKELVASALHRESHRYAKPFVVMNASAITRELAESELFGHARGAFTGATRDRRGAFRAAHGGTLFLDEIAALPLDLQPKLLRAVEEGVVRPVGSELSIPADVRLIAATCESLESMMGNKLFRADLYERLAVCVIHVPPLRERVEDIELLANHLLKQSELQDRALSRSAIARLRLHAWPGNVRQLRNVVLQAALRTNKIILAEHIEDVLQLSEGSIRRRISPIEAQYIFERVGKNASAAARVAQIPRSTMRDLLRIAIATQAEKTLET